MVKKFFVTMTDNFMSGWGRAKGKKNVFVVETNTLKQAEIIEKNAKKRSEMRYVYIKRKMPYYNPRSVLVSKRKFKDLDGIWKEK